MQKYGGFLVLNTKQVVEAASEDKETKISEVASTYKVLIASAAREATTSFEQQRLQEYAKLRQYNWVLTILKNYKTYKHSNKFRKDLLNFVETNWWECIYGTSHANIILLQQTFQGNMTIWKTMKLRICITSCHSL